jgi:hypothetical protein
VRLTSIFMPLLVSIFASCSSKPSSPPFCGLGAPPPGVGVALAVGAPCCPATANVACLGQGDETSGCPLSGVVLECLYAGAEVGSPNGGAPLDATCAPDNPKYTWKKVFTCPGGGVCGGGATLQSFGSLQCISGSSASAPLAGPGSWCSGDENEACSLDETQILQCYGGLWTSAETCAGHCGLADANCGDIACPVACLK